MHFSAQRSAFFPATEIIHFRTYHIMSKQPPINFIEINDAALRLYIDPKGAVRFRRNRLVPAEIQGQKIRFLKVPIQKYDMASEVVPHYYLGFCFGGMVTYYGLTTDMYDKITPNPENLHGGLIRLVTAEAPAGDEDPAELKEIADRVADRDRTPNTHPLLERIYYNKDRNHALAMSQRAALKPAMNDQYKMRLSQVVSETFVFIKSLYDQRFEMYKERGEQIHMPTRAEMIRHIADLTGQQVRIIDALFTTEGRKRKVLEPSVNKASLEYKVIAQEKQKAYVRIKMHNARMRSRGLSELEFDVQIRDMFRGEYKTEPPVLCPVLGVQLKYEVVNHDFHPRVWRKSVDGQYTKDNVCVMSNLASKLIEGNTKGPHKCWREDVRRVETDQYMRKSWNQWAVAHKTVTGTLLSDEEETLLSTWQDDNEDSDGGFEEYMKTGVLPEKK